MSRIRPLVAAAAMVAAVLPARVAPALAVAPSPTPQQTLAQLNAQLADEQSRLTDLNNQVEHVQADVDQLTRKLADDRQREADLGKQLAIMGRLEYEQPAFSLSSILEASSLQQLMSNIAQARLVANKQRRVLDQTHQLRRQDEQAHTDMTAKLDIVQAARDQASQIATQTLALRNSLQDTAARALADTVNAQARATVIPWSGSGPYPNHFTFGYCTYYVATRRYVPWFGNAIDWYPNARAYGYPEGSTPTVGSIMVSRESAVGHVAYVIAVNGGTFTVAEMNFTGWDVVDQRTITLGGRVPVVGFIYGQ